MLAPMPQPPSYSWTAPAWTGAEHEPVLYDDCEELLFCAALLEEALSPLAALDDGAELSSRVRRFLAAVSDHLAEVRAGLSAARRVSDLEEEVHQRSVQLLDEAGVVDEEALLALARAQTPGDKRALVEGALGAADGGEALAALSRLVDEHAEAEERSARRLGLQAAAEHEKEIALAEEGSHLLHDVHERAPPRERRVPRAAPGEPPRGDFELPLSALQICFRFTRVLGELDARLAAARAEEEPLRALREGRAHAARVLERVASVARARAEALATRRPPAEVPSYKDALPTHEDMARLLETQMALLARDATC